jgi:hypothetical protein
LIPSSIKTTVAASTVQAQADLDGFITRNNGRVISVRQQLITEAIASGAAPGAAKAAYRAQGGPIFGPGTGTSDSIPAWLSNGEHVLTAREVLAAGGHASVMAWRREILAARGMPAYATGGPVGSSATVRYAAPSSQPIVIGGGGRPSVTQQITMAPIRDQNPRVTAQLLGQEAARQLEGSV